MSLLDDVSIVVTPNGYKAGELYAVVPVPTEGAEEVVNSDFSSDTWWGLDSSWTISGGSANSNGTGTMYKGGILTIGKRYIVKVDVSAYTSGSLSYPNASYNIPSSIGTYTFDYVASSQTISFTGTSFVGSIDNVSVKEYTSADMDVTRATAATRVDENGLVNYAEIIGGEEITDGDFPAGTTAWEVTDGTVTFNNEATFDINSKIRQNIFDIGKVYKFTYEVTENTGGMTLRFYNGAAYTFVDNSVGIHTVYLTATSTTYFYISTLSGTSLTLKSVSVKEVTRDNVPRIDYTGGGCPHILAEPQRTNLITYSEDFSQSYWTKQSGVTPTYNTTETLSPDGTYNATKFIGNGSSGVLKGGISVTGVIARSVYLKSITGTVNVVLKDPNLTVTQKTLTVTEEWQRFELIESNGTSTQGIWIDDIPVSGIYIWGAQLEEGSYATSYIPTSGSTVTRNQDIFTRDGIGSLINSTEGTLFLELAANNVTTFKNISINSDGSNRVNFFIYTSSVTVNFDVGGVTQASLSYSIPDVTSFNKFAFTYKLNEFKLFVNGTKRATDTSGIVPSANTFDTVSFNDSFGNNFYGKVKQLQVYNTALTDEQLLQLTGESGTDFYESYAEMASALTYTIQ